MLPWAIALAGGVAAALVAYRRGVLPPARAAALGALRTLAVTLVLALLLGAPAAPGRPAPPLVALDASASWLRGGDSAAWQAAFARAVDAAGGDTVWLFGDSLRAAGARAAIRPTDAASRGAPAVERARAAGRSVLLLTDGEVGDAAALGDLPPGSRIEVAPRTARLDAAIIDVDAPLATLTGDSLEVRATVRAGALPVPSAMVTARLDGRVVTARAVEALPAGGERVLAFRLRMPDAPVTAVLTVTVAAGGDAELRNDSVSLPLEVARAAGVVFVSSAPDYEIRFLVPLMRGALALPARGYFRVAPGAWRREGSLTTASPAEVLAALRTAPLVILHGDTAALGPPRALTPAALLLLPGPDTIGGEWFAAGAPASPVAAALAGTPWDSLPPLAVARRVPAGEWSALDVARARRFDSRPAIAGSEHGRRSVVAGAYGFWRWQFRGGAAAVAYAALWGGILDWLVAERRDPRAALPLAGVHRAGEPVRWRRNGTHADTMVTVWIRRRGTAHGDTVRLHFAAGASTTESPPLPAGLYDLRVGALTALLAMNVSRELLPASPALRSIAVAGRAGRGEPLPLRDRGWDFLVAIVALCVEWWLRRRWGLR